MNVSYEQFFSPGEVQTYKRVKRGSMKISGIARRVVADAVGGTIGDPRGTRKEFVQTRLGLFRMHLGKNADNTTERAAHERLGAVSISIGDEQQLSSFLLAHGCMMSPAEVLEEINHQLQVDAAMAGLT